MDTNIIILLFWPHVATMGTSSTVNVTSRSEIRHRRARHFFSRAGPGPSISPYSFLNKLRLDHNFVSSNRAKPGPGENKGLQIFRAVISTISIVINDSLSPIYYVDT